MIRNCRLSEWVTQLVDLTFVLLYAIVDVIELLWRKYSQIELRGDC